DERLQQIIGAPAQDIEALAKFTAEQKAYLKTLANMDGNGPYFSNDVETLASAIYGAKFNEKNLPQSILYPLQNAGYITLERGTKSDGRGAKPFLVSPTEKLEKELVLP